MISVLMLTYNREKLVGRAIECILKQTYTDFEFIIVNNGSSDKSGEIADRYAENDPRIKVIHRERGNIGAGRNTALGAARGEYITFIDDDDLTEPDFLEFLLNLIKENNADISICGAADKVFDEKKIMTAEEALIELMWRKKYNVAFPTKMFRREIAEKLRFPEEGAFDDIALMYKLIAEAKTVAYHGLPKYTFYRHEDNNSKWTTNHRLITAEILDEYLDCYRIRTEWLSERFPDSAAAFSYFEWSFMISMVEKIHRLGLAGCEKQLELMTKTLTKHHKEFLNAPEILDFEREWMEKYIMEGTMDFKSEWKKIRTEYLSEEWKKEKEVLKHKITSQSVILYGVGFFGAVLVKNFASEGINVTCFCDSNKHGIDSETGLNIISPDELKTKYSDANIIISVANPSTEISVRNSILNLGFTDEHIFAFKDAYKFMHVSRVEPVFLGLETLEKHLNGYERAYNMISDEISQKIILQTLNNYLFNRTYNYDDPINSYFPEEFVFSDKEIFIDAGLYTGDTSQEFIRRVNGKYEKIIGFDIDENNLSAAYKNLAPFANVEIISKGLWSHSSAMSAKLGLTAGSNINEGGDCTVNLTSLDELFADAPRDLYPTFIKMDIEGSEKQALIGAEKIIRTAKPKLAICVYHKPEDIYEIPDLIKSFNPDYKLFLKHYSPYVWDTVLYAY